MRTILSTTLLMLTPLSARAQELGDEGFADSGGVKLHYVTAGKGPLVILIHGFTDFWYSWRDQMPALAKHFQVVAIDQRGYNKSDQPKGVDNYKLEKLVADVDAVRKHFKQDKAVVVGHDWGGLVAWTYAMLHPEQTDRLIVLNLPHPKGMMSYYRANDPREPYKDDQQFPPVKCPVLMIHGLLDPYLLPGALNDTWKWVEKDFTLVTVPKAGHFVHRDAPEVVTSTMVRWL